MLSQTILAFFQSFQVRMYVSQSHCHLIQKDSTKNRYTGRSLIFILKFIQFLCEATNEEWMFVSLIIFQDKNHLANWSFGLTTIKAKV